MDSCPKWILALALCSLGYGQATYTAASAAQLTSLATQLQPGDTLLLQPGTYNVSTLSLSNRVGTPTQWITIRSAGPQRAVIQGTAVQNVINVNNCHYLRLEDLEITHTPGAAGIDAIKFNTGYSSSHFVIDNCYIHHVSGNGILSQSELLDHLEVVNTEIAYAESCGIYLGYDSPLREATNTVIRNCYIHHCSQDAAGNPTSTGYGIQIKPLSWGSRIENCVLHDVGGTTRAAIALYYTTFGGNELPGRWNVVRGNVIWNSRNEGIYVCNSAVVENNVVVDTPSGIVAARYGGCVMDNLKIRHNTVYRSPGRGFYLLDMGAAGPSVQVANNASLVTSSSAFAYRVPSGSGGAVIFGNAYSGTNYAPGVPASSFVQVGTPSEEFVDPNGSATGLDLYPKSTSQLRDGAPAPADVGLDLNGKPRPSGTAVDFGAYEWSQTTNPGWHLATSFKPPLDALTPPVQDLDLSQGGTLTFQIRPKAPPGSVVFLLPSARGPDPAGYLPVLTDAFTMLPFSPDTSSLFVGYAATVTSPTQTLTASITFPPLPPREPISIYHAAVVVTPWGTILDATNWVRARVFP